VYHASLAFDPLLALMLPCCGEGHRLAAKDTSESRPRRKGGVQLATSIGGYVGFCILAGAVVGVLLDKVIHTGPLFLIAGVVIGFIVSFYLVYRLAMGELGD